jgi:hypothetical protein
MCLVSGSMGRYFLLGALIGFALQVKRYFQIVKYNEIIVKEQKYVHKHALLSYLGITSLLLNVCSIFLNFN